MFNSPNTNRIVLNSPPKETVDYRYRMETGQFMPNHQKHASLFCQSNANYVPQSYNQQSKNDGTIGNMSRRHPSGLPLAHQQRIERIRSTISNPHETAIFGNQQNIAPNHQFQHPKICQTTSATNSKCLIYAQSREKENSYQIQDTVMGKVSPFHHYQSSNLNKFSHLSTVNQCSDYVWQIQNQQSNVQQSPFHKNSQRKKKTSFLSNDSRTTRNLTDAKKRTTKCPSFLKKKQERLQQRENQCHQTSNQGNKYPKIKSKAKLFLDLTDQQKETDELQLNRFKKLSSFSHAKSSSNFETTNSYFDEIEKGRELTFPMSLKKQASLSYENSPRVSPRRQQNSQWSFKRFIPFQKKNMKFFESTKKETEKIYSNGFKKAVSPRSKQITREAEMKNVIFSSNELLGSGKQLYEAQKMQEKRVKFGNNVEEKQHVVPSQIKQQSNSRQSAVPEVPEDSTFPKQPRRRISGVVIADIKDALIGCDLFTEDDCQRVLDEHGKDILKPVMNDKTKWEESYRRIKTSLKQLLETPEPTPEEEQWIAEQCEQKRSKWILEQTNTIKESLKELSEFNTERQMLDSPSDKKLFPSLPAFDEVIERQADETMSNVGQEDGQSQFEINSYAGSQVFKKKSSPTLWVEGSKLAISTYQNVFQECNSQVKISDFTLTWSSESRHPHFITYTALHKKSGAIFSIKKYTKMSILASINEFILSHKIQMMLNHPNIEKVYQIFCDEENMFVLCEHHTSSLAEYIMFEKSSQMIDSASGREKRYLTLKQMPSPSINSKKEMLLQIVESVEELHISGIVHRAIRPSHVIICHNDVCKLSGFNQMSIVNERGLNESYSEYLSPETLLDSLKTSVDIWCLGVLTFELFVGKRPFQSESKNKTAQNILRWDSEVELPPKFECLRQILDLALKKKPQERASVFDLQKSEFIRTCKSSRDLSKSSIYNELDQLFSLCQKERVA